MRKHGWQLPYHPLQVVAVSVFLALGFAFYVFFAPFVGKDLHQYIAMGIYTLLIMSAFGLYIWCAAADPADPGVFKSKKYIKILDNKKHDQGKDSELGGEPTSSTPDTNAVAGAGEKNFGKNSTKGSYASAETKKEASSSPPPVCFTGLLALLLPCASSCSEDSPEQQMSEDGMFYCSLCEVEVYKYSKHCRVCDKCVDCFDHHCRWLNNCIGKRNYRKFFTLMVSAVLLLILQWSTGILVLICCFLEKKRFSEEITLKLGSSFTTAPFVIVVATCTVLAMIATLPLAQLFFFHILLVKKGISTYDYIMALREQELPGVGAQQSPQMSPVSSLTGMSSASSFNNFQYRAKWCTPPRLFIEDQYDVVPPETGSVSSRGTKAAVEEPTKRKNPAAVKISPWALARLNAEEISRAATAARKRSKILQPVARRQETEDTFGGSARMIKEADNGRKRPSNRIRLPADLTFEPLRKKSSEAAIGSRQHFSTSASSSLGPLQPEAQSVFHTSRAIMSNSVTNVVSSPDSSIDSPEVRPFRVSSSGAEEAREVAGLSAANLAPLPLSRSTSDGYEASGGEDSDRVPTRFVQRSTNWSSILFGAEYNRRVTRLNAPSSSFQVNNEGSFNK